MASRKLTLYIKGVSAGTVAIPVNMGSGLAGLWLMTQILEKGEYGALALAQAWTVFIGAFGTLGLDRTLVYRVAAMERSESRLVGGELATSVVLIVFLSAVTLACVFLLVVDLLSNALVFESFWFAVFALTIPFAAVTAVLSAWQTANDRAHVAQMLTPGQSVVRFFLLVVAWWVLPDANGVAMAIVVGTVLSTAAWFFFIPRGSFGSFKWPSRSEWSYGSKLLFTGVASNGIVRIDLIVLGVFVNPSAVAEYSVAKRLADLAQVGNNLMAPIFTPRMRYALTVGDTVGLTNEYRQNRVVTAFVVLFLFATYYVFGQPVLTLFGDYVEAWPILLVLVAGFLIRSLFGATGRYLGMAGYANLALYTTMVLLVANVILCLYMIPLWGGLGAALATLTAMLATTSTIAWLIWRLDRFQTLTLPLAVSVIAVLAAAFSWAFYPDHASVITATCVVLVAVLMLIGEKDVLVEMVRAGARPFGTRESKK